MANLDNEIATFDTLRPNLEADHMGEWALISENELIGTFASFDEAAQFAVPRLGRGPYLIRQIGALPVVLPALVRYQPIHAENSLTPPLY